MDIDFEVVELHCRSELLEQAARLLNTEWHRSLEARYAHNLFLDTRPLHKVKGGDNL